MRYKGFVIFWFLSFSFFCVQGGRSRVDEIVRLAALYPENIVPDSSSWLDPDFDFFYDTFFAPSLFSTGAQLSGMQGVSCAEYFLDSFATYVAPQVATEIYEDHVFIKKNVKKGDKIYIIGDLHGAIHSFARLLIAWSRDGIIQPDLTITAPNTLFVFLGDYINRSPYGFLLLPLLLEFSKKNTGRVLLLRGMQERTGYWQQFLSARSFLKRSVSAFSSMKTGTLLPWSQEIDNFFLRLSDGLLLYHENGGERVVLSHHAVPTCFQGKKDLTAVIQGEQRQFRDISSQGLLFDQFLAGSAVWNVFSAPIPIYTRVGLLHRDSYAILEVEKTFSQSIITGIERECVALDSASMHDQTFLPDALVKVYSLAYGCLLPNRDAIETLKKSRSYFVCSSVDLSTGLRGMGIGIKEGMEACFLQANEQRRIPATFFRVVCFDDGYDPDRMEKNLQHFREEYQADGMLLAMGTPTVMKILPRVQREDLRLFFPATGSLALREVPSRTMIHFRNSYAEEVFPLIMRTHDMYGARKFMFIYQDDLFGRPLMESAVAFIKRKYPHVKVESLAIVVGHSLSSVDLAKLREFSPDAIGFFVSTQMQLNGVVDALGLSFLLGRYLFAIDFSTNIFHEFSSRWGVTLLQASSFPAPSRKKGRIMDLYRSAMKMYRYSQTISSVEGYFASALFLAGLEKSYPDVRAVSIMQALEQLDVGDLFGFPLKFNSETRALSCPIWISDRGRFYQVEEQSGSYLFTPIVL